MLAIGRVPQALDLSLLVGYLFVRSFLFILKVCEGPSYLHPTFETLPSPTGPLNGCRRDSKPFAATAALEKEKINGRIRMNFIN